ncbi:MAG: ligase-associated DNA damage response endonuclease PdeM [Bacteroidia bacterium]|nr:ligase-associated DNA damage response endonuclease PdeM [Bacteroidia bacterium]
MNSLPFSFRGQTFQLHPHRAIYWEEENSLLLADLHLGKARHFRRAGLAVPIAVSEKNIEILESLALTFNPERLLILGDLFHSSRNYAWDQFKDWLATHPDMEAILIPGNHDFHQKEAYEALGLEVEEEPYIVGDFALSHIPLKEAIEGKYNLAGHIHPAVRLSGEGRQSMSLSCFYFGEWQGLLPAFGKFTGNGYVELSEGDRVFVLAEDEVIEME